jgi:hypothetical protein
MLLKKQVILAKNESTYRTDPTPATSANEIFVDSFEETNEGLRILERNGPKNTLGGYAPVYAGTLIGITITLRARGSGAAGTAPEFGPLLRACGFGETLNASTSVVYAPVSSGFESVTIWRYYDGKLRKYTGCVGNVSMSQDTGGFHVFTFNMVGHFSTETDVSLATPSYDSTAPIAAIGGTFTFDSYNAIINNLSWDMGNSISQAPDYNQSNGYGELRITDRNVTGSFDPEDVLVATYDFWAEFVGASTAAMSTAALGPAAGNKMALSLPALKLTNLTDGDRDGVLIRNVEFMALESSGDDQITITFT